MYVYVCVCVCNRMETHTWLSRDYKFISAENISILSVSSDIYILGDWEKIMEIV